MSIFKLHEDNLSESLRRTAVGLTGLQKRLFSDIRKIRGGGKCKFPLFVALAAILASQFPIAGAEAQTSTTCPSITGEVTSTLTVAANQQCTIESSGSITVEAEGVDNYGVVLNAGSTLVNRGTITVDSTEISGIPGVFHNNYAVRISGAGSKVINYGNINVRQLDGRAFDILQNANNVEIEFLSGSLIASKEPGRYFIVRTLGLNTNLTFGGTALISDAANSDFFSDNWGSGNVIILLPGAAIRKGGKLRPFAGVSSELGGGDDELKIGNFYAGTEPVGHRTGWVHAGQWTFGDGTDELIIDTSPGVRFSNHGGRNHYRHTGSSRNAIHSLETMRIRNGNVVLGGSVYMPTGKVYVHDFDGGRLTFEIGKRRDADNPDNAESPERVGEMIISRLVAKELIFSNHATVFIQFAHYLDASDIERFRTQLVPWNLSQLDATTLSLDGAGNELSKILKVEKVSYLADYQKAKDPPEDPVDITDYVSHMKVMSSGPSGIRLVGYIIVKSDNNAEIGRLLVHQEQDIGQLRFSSAVTGRTPVSSGTGTGGGTSTGGDPGDGDGTGDGDDTADAGTGDTDTGDGTSTGGDPGDGDGTGDGDDTADAGTGDTDTGDAGTGSAGAGGSGGSGGGGGILVIGLLAALMGGLDLDESESELGNYYAFDRKPAKNRSRSSSYFSGLFRPERGVWVRPAESRFTSFGTSYFGAVSHRMSWDLQQSGDYFLRASLSPATSVSPSGWHSSASGETLSLTGGWQRDDRRLQFGITHGRYDANAKMYDSATKGNLFGESKFRHTSVHASAVQELSDGPMKVSASASLTAGHVKQAAYAAENAVMRATVPAYRQSYTGTRLGFSAKSRKWFALSDAVSVKPHLKVTSMRTRSSVNDPVWLRQSDKVGALSFENATVLQGIPKSLNVVGIGTDVKPSDSRGVWRLGYAGMEVDGEYQHAAVAAYRMRF